MKSPGEGKNPYLSKVVVISLTLLKVSENFYATLRLQTYKILLTVFQMFNFDEFLSPGTNPMRRYDMYAEIYTSSAEMNGSGKRSFQGSCLTLH